MALPSFPIFWTHHIAHVMEQDHPEYNEGCAICQDNFTNPIETPCGHLFCSECARTWFDESTTCPHCRRELYDPDNEEVPDDPDNEEVPDDNEDVPDEWIAGVDDFDYDCLSFEVDRNAVLARLDEVEDSPWRVERDPFSNDSWFEVRPAELIPVAVAAMIDCYHNVDEQHDPTLVLRLRAHLVEVVHFVARIIQRASPPVVQVSCLRGLFENTCGNRHKRHLERLPTPNQNFEQYQEERQAWMDLADGVAWLLDYVCDYASDNFQVPSRVAEDLLSASCGGPRFGAVV